MHSPSPPPPAALTGLARSLVPRRLRNWLRSPRATLLWLRDHGAHAAGLDPVAQIRPGWRLRCHPLALRTAYRAHLDDPDQVAELDAFIAACAPDMVLFDIGAHFGLFSFAALHYGGPLARAVAVDPSPVAVRMTRLVARLNGVEDRVAVLGAAAGAEEGTLELVDGGVIAAGYYMPADAAHPAGERTRVDEVTVDGLARRCGCTPTHLKIDVEGAEADVLRGARGTLTGATRPLVFLELHTAITRRGGGDPARPLRLLAECGYAVEGLERPGAEGELLARDVVRVLARPKP